MTGTGLTVTRRPRGDGGMELAAVGELDMSNVDRFEAALVEAIAEAGPGGTTALDLRGVQYLDSAAINVLFAHADRIAELTVHPLLLRALTISGLDELVPVRTAPG